MNAPVLQAAYLGGDQCSDRRLRRMRAGEDHTETGGLGCLLPAMTPPLGTLPNE